MGCLMRQYVVASKQGPLVAQSVERVEGDCGGLPGTEVAGSIPVQYILSRQAAQSSNTVRLWCANSTRHLGGLCLDGQCSAMQRC